MADQRKAKTPLARLLLLTACAWIWSCHADNSGPSFSCKKVEDGSIEQMICNDSALSAQDRQLAEVYTAALAKANNEYPPVLKAEQRGWIKGRNECWKSDDKRKCVADEYRLRIAELQARYRLVPARGPFAFACDGNAANEVTVTYFETDPPTLIAERGDSVSLMYRQPAASGTRYQGRNESFWEHQGEARITWGYGAPEMHCQRAPLQ
ncbi:MliC family protein [Microbulbifer hainanensis]|uniref:MliC family protein n=1 Tax=Microbulbifer hainanensis TaxID=2735675 RepID=UPI001865F9BE|nr:MliC family protein [Microbulbifer hainanensis]